MCSMLLKSDAFVVINAIKHCKVDNVCFDLIITDCISLLTKIWNCSISFVKRSLNLMAHVSTMTFRPSFDC